MKDTRDPVSKEAPISDFERKFFIISLSIIVVLILFFTYLHYWQPQILGVPTLALNAQRQLDGPVLPGPPQPFGVPNNSDVSTWRNPSFEHTCVYQSATEAARERLRLEGIPGTSLGNLIFMELFALFNTLLCLWHARKHFGKWMAWCFLLGSFVFTGVQESFWILFGRAGHFAIQGFEPMYGTYWFTRGLTWFIETPVNNCFGWFYIAYACVWMAQKTFPKWGPWTQAAVGGLLAMIIDLWMDPVNTSPESMNWVWATGDFVRIFGIPQSNFVGWFLLIFVFAIIWGGYLPRWEKAWGRAKATKMFLWTLVVADIGVIAFQWPWALIVKGILMVSGVNHTVLIPPGW